MKISIEQVEATLLEKKIDPVKIKDIIKDLQQIVEEEKEERQSTTDKKEAWEYVVIIHDPNNKLQNQEFGSWVVQQKDGQDAGLILSKLSDAAKNQNEAAKRKKSVISNLTELFEGLKSKWTKEKGVRIKTKELTRVIVSSGKLV